MDQNEKLAKWKIMLFAAVDGFSRYMMIHHKVVTCLTGPSHTDFFDEAIQKSGLVPYTLSVDATSEWNHRVSIIDGQSALSCYQDAGMAPKRSCLLSLDTTIPLQQQ